MSDPPGPIEVGDDLRVKGHDWLYVVGDANGKLAAHARGQVPGARWPPTRSAANADARLREDRRPAAARDVHRAAGRRRRAHARPARARRGCTSRVVDVSTDGTAGASFHGKGAGGTCRIVVDEDRRVIVGATFVGVDVAEWLHAATIAIVGRRCSLDDLWHAIPAFPTRSEVWLNLLQAYGL